MVKWFYSMKKEGGLFENVDIIKGHGLIVCWIDELEKKRFSYFNSYTEIYKHIISLEEHDRTFFEVIPGNWSQKPHFDIDMVDPKEDPQTIISTLINKIIEYGAGYIKYEDLLVYSSHGKYNDCDKYSYHIVVNNWFHNNNLEAKQFYVNVNNLLPEEYRQYVDHMAYSTLQQFRMLWSTKRNHNRFKRQIIGTTNNHFHDFNNSLITNVENCKYISIVVQERKEYINNEVNTQQINDALITFKKFDPSHYKIRNIKNNLIILQRLEASACLICDRIHESENPFLIIENNVLFFCCRRNIKKHLIGVIDKIEDVTNLFPVNQINEAEEYADLLY